MKMDSADEVVPEGKPGSAGRNTTSMVRAIALGASANTVSLLPVFLTGAMAVQISRDLTFGTAALGLATAIYRGTGALVSPTLGRLTDRLGVTRSLRLAALLAGTSALGIATFARSWTSLVLWLMLAGCSQGFGRPAANRLLSNNVDPRRLGTAFGFKNSAPPTATIIAGLSVPLIALQFGWRYAFFMTAFLALGVGFFAGRRRPNGTAVSRRLPRDSSTPAPVANRRLILMLGTALGLGTMTSSVITTFYVDAAVKAGTPEGQAGLILAAASGCAILSRIGSGILSDRIVKGHLGLCAGLIWSGAVGVGLLALNVPAIMSFAALLATAGAWGFNGVFWYAAIRSSPESPGTLTGLLAPGALLGSTIGPVLFGWIVERTSYPVGWTFSACMGLVAGAAMLASSRRLSEAGSLFR